jgi:hypothetical protein
MRKMRDIMSPAPVGVVSIGDLALESDASSPLSGVSAAPPNS